MYKNRLSLIHAKWLIHTSCCTSPYWTGMCGNTIYSSVIRSQPVPLPDCSSPWTQHGRFFYMFGNPLEARNQLYCVGQNQLLIPVMRCCLNPKVPHSDFSVSSTFCHYYRDRESIWHLSLKKKFVWGKQIYQCWLTNLNSCHTIHIFFFFISGVGKFTSLKY